MQNLFFIKSKNQKAFVFLFFVACIAYWPVSLGIFSLKNDALIYFLPWRRHISESIQNGHFPFWSPYLFTGLPLHSDMPAGTWNPVVLFISLFTKYDMRILEWELFLYIFLGGLGMYKLIVETGNSGRTAIICAASYMCCGFITDSGSFISWINCAAYLPFVFLFFYRILNTPSLITSLKLGMSVFLLFSTCDPSFLFFSSYIMLAAFIYWCLKNRNNTSRIYNTTKYLLAGVILLLLLSTPEIISYVEFLPYYARGKGANLSQALTDPFPPFSTISYLIPNAVAKPHKWLSTDIAMRNAYCGIFIIPFFLTTIISKIKKNQKFILCALLFSFLFSMGEYTPLRKWCYDFLPLLNTFRHPAIIRLFTTIGIILLAAPALENYFNNAETNRKRLKTFASILLIIVATFFLYYFLKNGSDLLSLFKNRYSVKQIINTISFEEIAIVEAFIQSVFLITFLALFSNKKIITGLLVFNVIVFAFISLPFTFISQTKTSVVNNYISSFPSNYPTPDLKEPIYVNKRQNSGAPMFGYSEFYSKKISIQNDLMSPTVNSDYIKFLNDSLLRAKLDKFPFAYISSTGFIKDASASLTIKKFSPSQFIFIANAGSNDSWLYLFQQYNHSWKAHINGHPQDIQKGNTAFMKIKIPPGNSIVDFNYMPGFFIYLCMFISFCLFLTTTIYLFILFIKKNYLRLSKQLY